MTKHSFQALDLLVDKQIIGFDIDQIIVFVV